MNRSCQQRGSGADQGIIMRNVEEVKQKPDSARTQANAVVKQQPSDAGTAANASCEKRANEPEKRTNEKPANGPEKPANAHTVPPKNGGVNGGATLGTLPHANKAVANCGARTPKGPCSKPPAHPKASRCAQHGGHSTGASLQGRLKVSKLYRQRDDEERLAEGHVVCSPELIAELRRRHIHPVAQFVRCSRAQVVRAREGRPVFRYNALAFERAVRHVAPCDCGDPRWHRPLT